MTTATIITMQIIANTTATTMAESDKRDIRLLYAAHMHTHTLSSLYVTLYNQSAR